MNSARILVSVLVVLILSGQSQIAAAEESDDERLSFNRDVRPILSDHCFSCHGPDSTHREAGLRLDIPIDVFEDRGDYQVIVPGDPDLSELVYRISTDDEFDKMPPDELGKPLDDDEIAILTRWISEGAAFEAHWSLVPPNRPTIPSRLEAESTLGRPRSPIDRFLNERIEATGVQTTPAADRATLLRRVSLDLTGLPPRPNELEAFLNDSRPDAFERQVDRLLSSPRFGERMAIFWFDLVRFANTVGYHGDQEHQITPYRDYVIQALNANLPFDQFTKEQLAGDLLPNPTTSQRIASGYNRLLQTTHEGGAQDREYLAKYAADRVRNLSTVWLGATIGCAECHDHKYDPYTQRDFYSLAAFFDDLQQQGAYSSPNSSPTIRAPEIVVPDTMDRERLQTIESELERLRSLSADQQLADSTATIEELEAERDRLRSRARRTMVSVSVEPRMTRILPRGDWMDQSGPIVAPDTPGSLPDLMVDDRRPTRLDLADWLTRPDNPLPARVLVNRLWAIFYGHGLSRSLDDYGSQGRWPSHPQLLDWLAIEFIESDWDLKGLIRLLVTSDAYRRSSTPSAELLEADPENELFARQDRFRIPAELIRDQALAVSGLLIEQFGGSSARPYQPAGYYRSLNFPKRTYQVDKESGQYRRGVYMHWQRQFLHPMLRAFDAPTREECTAERSQSNTPLGALTLLNDPSFVEASRCLGARVIAEGGDSIEDQIRFAWILLLSREPTEAELEASRLLFIESRDYYQANPSEADQLLGVGLAPIASDIKADVLAAWTTVSRALLNLHESITRY